MDFIRIEHASKNFGGVRALKDISFSVQRGEIHGLVGENGSGKSTLIQILAGSLEADTGVINIDGKQIGAYGPLAGIQQGIGVIYQDLSLFPNLSVLENVCLSNQIKAGSKFYTSKSHVKEVKSILEQLDADAGLNDLVEELPIAKQQMVAIARALYSNPKLIIFDEPTTALTRGEINNLFRIIQHLKKQKISIIFISHKLDEITEICDSITVLRDGNLITSRSAEGLTIPEIEKLMVGESTVYRKRSESNQMISDELILRVKHLTKKNNFNNINFNLRKGEILGITGLLGSGRTELASSIFGVNPYDSGTIEVDGVEVSIRSVREAVNLGIAYVPENRLTQGLVMRYSQRDNIVLAALGMHTHKGLLDEEAMSRTGQTWIDNLDVKTDDQFKEVKTLSGGNQQKIVLGKWFVMNPRILILDGPTVGVDVGAKAGIFKTIWDMVEATGMSVILISDEIREVTANCQRVLVMHNGRIVKEFTKAEEIDDEYIQGFLESQKALV